MSPSRPLGCRSEFSLMTNSFKGHRSGIVDCSSARVCLLFLSWFDCSCGFGRTTMEVKGVVIQRGHMLATRLIADGVHCDRLPASQWNRVCQFLQCKLPFFSTFLYCVLWKWITRSAAHTSVVGSIYIHYWDLFCTGDWSRLPLIYLFSNYLCQYGFMGSWS